MTQINLIFIILPNAFLKFSPEMDLYYVAQKINKNLTQPPWTALRWKFDLEFFINTLIACNVWNLWIED